jgi:hypothetical protein
MDLRSAILAIVTGWAPAAPPTGMLAELPAERAERLETIAEAVDIASGGDPAAAAAVLVIWGRESRLARWVHDGTVKGDHGRAACMGSLHPSKKVPDWSRLTGVEIAPTVRCALRTLQVFRSGIFLCAGGIRNAEARAALAFEYYARGSCHLAGKESLRRAREWTRLSARLWEVR